MGSNKFVRSEEIYEMYSTDIIRKLPKPTMVAKSELQMEQMYFPIDFASYDMYSSL